LFTSAEFLCVLRVLSGYPKRHAARSNQARSLDGSIESD